MLLSPVATLANLVDHRYRGASLTAEDRGAALKNFAKLVSQWDGAAVHIPPIDDLLKDGTILQFDVITVHILSSLDLLDFISEKGTYADSQGFECHPFNFWSAIYSGQSPFVPLGFSPFLR